MFFFGSKKLCLPGWLKKHQLGAKDKNVINAWAVRLTLDARLRGDDVAATTPSTPSMIMQVAIPTGV